jgi:2,3-bisphosphoglycerate-dependent phosphoglycerate mutase
MNIYVIRHCKATGQEIEAELTREGFEQANGLAEFLSNYPIQKVISSPYVRARQTIEPFLKIQGMGMLIDNRLGERVLSGNNEPLPNWLDDLRATFEDDSISFNGGESSKEATDRIMALVEEIMNDEAENIALVSHGNLTTLLLRAFNESYGFNEWQAMTNPDVFVIKLTGNNRIVERIWKGKNDVK